MIMYVCISENTIFYTSYLKLAYYYVDDLRGPGEGAFERVWSHVFIIIKFIDYLIG